MLASPSAVSVASRCARAMREVVEREGATSGGERLVMAQRTRFDRVAAALAACALVAAFCSLADAKHRSAPHVVLLVLDDTGWNHVPWHSGDAGNAPHLATLVGEGAANPRPPPPK